MLENLTELLLPALLLLAGAAGIAKKQDVYGGMLTGAQDGLRLMLSLTPTLVLMLTAVTMLRESGFFALLTPVFAPVFRLAWHPAGGRAAGTYPASQRQRGAGRRDRSDAGIRGRFPDRPDGSGHARFDRNDVLHHQRLFWRGRRQKNALCAPGSPDRRPDRLLHGRTERARVFPIAPSKRLPLSCPDKGSLRMYVQPFSPLFAR